MKTTYVITQEKQVLLERLLANGVKLDEISRLIGVPYYALRGKLKRRRDGDENWHCRKIETPRERWEKTTPADEKRDTLRCEVYQAVQMSNGGITGEDVAKATGFKIVDVERELLDMARVRCGCRLVYCEAGKWRACEFNRWGLGPESDGIRRYKVTGVEYVEAA